MKVTCKFSIIGKLFLQRNHYDIQFAPPSSCRCSCRGSFPVSSRGNRSPAAGRLTPGPATPPSYLHQQYKLSMQYILEISLTLTKLHKFCFYTFSYIHVCTIIGQMHILRGGESQIFKMATNLSETV